MSILKTLKISSYICETLLRA